ncbi:MAG: HAMP domain-containing sensor histidine kinase [Candidatus Hydrothermarchaeales archaeon]
MNYRNNEAIMHNPKIHWTGYIVGSMGLVLGFIYLVLNYMKFGTSPIDRRYTLGYVFIFTVIPIYIVAGYLLNKKISLENELMEKNKELTERNKELFESYVKLKEADQLKSNFLMSVSHELRTPLNAVLVFSGLLKKGVYGRLNRHQDESVGLILNSGQNLLSLIDSLLDLSKIEAGEMGLLLTEYQLKDVVEETVNMIKESIEEKNLKIEVDGDPDVPAIYGDRNKVKYILTSLVENAVKFTDNGTVSIRYRINTKSFYLTVKDTGIGIKEEDYNQIFREFVQLDGSSTREHGGTGLGLTITKKFIELHHGRINVESSYGSWTEFKVELPIHYS